MPTCRKLVEPKGRGTAFPCSLNLPEDHEGPCAASEIPASLAQRAIWSRDSQTAAMAAEAPAAAARRETEVDLSHFQTEQRAVEAMVEPGSISKRPGESDPRYVPEQQFRQEREQTPEPDKSGWCGQCIAAQHGRCANLGGTARVVVECTCYRRYPEPHQVARANQDAAEKQLTRVPHEPPPEEGEGDVWAEIIGDMTERRQYGIDKYNTPLQRFNGRDAINDAYQEALDLVVYLRQASGEREIIKTLFAVVYFALREGAAYSDVAEPLGELAILLGVIDGPSAPLPVDLADIEG